jgi:hypothetical protein
MRHLKDNTKDSPDDESLINIAKLLYDSSIMASGFTVAETSEFSKRIYHIVGKGLGVDPNAEIPEEVVEEEEEVTLCLHLFVLVLLFLILCVIVRVPVIVRVLGLVIVLVIVFWPCSC